MVDLLALFRKNVETVVEDHREATAALVRRLKQLTPQDFLRRGPDVWSQLSMSQYRDVVETIAPQIHLPGMHEETMEPALMLETISRWWRARSTLVQSIYLTTIMTVVVVTIAIAAWPTIAWTLAPYTLVRNVDPRSWPPCSRLARNVDGCVYVPTQDLNWEWIAYHLAMPVEDLLRTNNHLPVAFAPARSKVTIWRSRAQLVRSKQ
jgi:hypothetical protein